jgi:RNA polymerase sigma factor (sigma-70 family)
MMGVDTLARHDSDTGFNADLDSYLDTAAWLAAARRGDAEAWERLVDTYDPMLRARVRRFRLSHEDAQDVVQTTWLLAWQNLAELRQEDRLPGWLTTIATRECLKLVRRTREICTADLNTVDRPDDHMATADRELARTWLEHTLTEVTRELPAAQQVLFAALRESAEPRYGEVARRLGRPIGSIGPSRARCFKKLRVLLQEREVGAGFLD